MAQHELGHSTVPKSVTTPTTLSNNTSVYFECDEDNELHGNPTLKCAADGTLSDDLPTCKYRHRKEKPFTSSVVTKVTTGLHTSGCVALIAASCASLSLSAFLSVFNRERFLHFGQEISLILAYTFIITLIEPPQDPNIPSSRCEFVAMVIQTAFISAATFLALESVDSFLVNTNVTSGKAISVPVASAVTCSMILLTTVTTAIVAFGKYRSDFACWVNYNEFAISVGTVFPMMVLAVISLFVSEAAMKHYIGTNLPLSDRLVRTSAFISTNSIFLKTVLLLGAFVSGSVAAFGMYPGMASVSLGFNISLAIYIFVTHALSKPKIHAYLKSKGKKLTDKIFAHWKSTAERKKEKTNQNEREGSGTLAIEGK